MINPQELIKISIENSQDKIDKCLIDIQERIINAANKGEFSYLYNGNKYSSGLLHYVTENLTKLGYKVEYKNSVLEISWYDTEIKQTVSAEEKKTEVNKPNKSVQKSEGTKATGKNTTILSNSEG
jgi:hypothetical protein